jgi:hypothetical protein
MRSGSRAVGRIAGCVVGNANGSTDGKAAVAGSKSSNKDSDSDNDNKQLQHDDVARRDGIILGHNPINQSINRSSNPSIQ